MEQMYYCFIIRLDDYHESPETLQQFHSQNA